MSELDLQLALELEEQFKYEAEIESGSDLVYKRKPNLHLNNSKSLTDPSWELVDPTPDIHNLFLVFNQKYFWGRLLTVCVSWSKRMTSCAGICSYEGRAGLCKITLSEPLLKLRPRKDLIETLLHEMIHAYLFVTENNRDRDGHGPEFHKHMYRINKETGTNITVYHDFHDEVRLYKQHWWRCNGICQKWKPYFGVVRRAMNRAPGPNDFWWADHAKKCGGTFVKIKEPDNFKSKKNKEKENTKPKNNDIRKYINSSNSQNNVKGFKDLTKKSSGTALKNNSSSTVIITKKTNTDVNKTNNKISIITPFTGEGNTLNKESKMENKDYSIVRNHWLEKFQNDANTKKRIQTPSDNQNGLKRFRENTADETVVKTYDLDGKNEQDEEVDCPICTKKIKRETINEHLDNCLINTNKKKTEEICFVCNKKIPIDSFNFHVNACLDNDREVNHKSDEDFHCLVCGKKVEENDLQSHLDECMDGIFEQEFEEMPTTSDQKCCCPFCFEQFSNTEMENHINICFAID